jgi:hypothetical protein
LRLWEGGGLKRYNGVKIECRLKKWSHKRGECKKTERKIYFEETFQVKKNTVKRVEMIAVDKAHLTERNSLVY